MIAFELLYSDNKEYTHACVWVQVEEIQNNIDLSQ